MTIKAAFFSSGKLWITDGTAAGTALLTSTNASIYEGDAALGSEILFNAYVPYTSSSAYYGDAIGVTDGTASGTTYIAEGSSVIRPDFTNSTVSIGSKLINEESDNQLVVTDGTAAGTLALTSPVLPVPFDWYIESSLYSLGNLVIFEAENVHADYNGSVNDLWVTNGTSAGTVAIVPAGASVSGLSPSDITVFGNKALFLGYDASGYQTLWVTDGTANGTTEIYNTNLPADSYATNFLALGSKVLFEAEGIDSKYSLWITDGTSAGTTELYQLPDSYSTGVYTYQNLYPTPLVSFNGKALFFGYDMNDTRQLWVTDGTTAGTRELSVPTLNVLDTASNFFVDGKNVLFEATDSLGKIGLWISDGTSAGTKEITPSNTYFYGLLDGATPSFALAGSLVAFEGEDAAGKSGLWVTNGTAAGTYEITSTSGASIAPSDLVSFGLPLLSISGTTPGQSTKDNTTVTPFKTVKIGDTGTGVTDTVTITLSSAANGALSKLGTGSYNATTGVYTISGTAAAITTAVDALVFTPTAHQVAAGQTVTTSFTIAESDTAGYSTSDTTTTLTTTAVTAAPSVVNASGGGSYRYVWFPTSTVRETITSYSGSNATGTTSAVIVDNTNGSALVFAYNPTAGAKQTTQNWSAYNASTGAPYGSLVADVVDNIDGSSYVYAYNPTSTVTQTAQKWSATNAADGSPAGSQLADVVNNTDGTTLVYAYNPTSTVTQTTTNWSATNASTGAAAGTETAVVVDNTSGTAIVYAFSPTANVSKTATFYSGFTASTGAPTGNATALTIDYTNGQSAITTYSGTGGSTLYYSGPDGTGSLIAGITGATTAAAPSTGSIVITGTGQTIDPGSAGATIQFLSGAGKDSVVLHAGAADTILGFDPAAGDTLDLRSLFASAGVELGSDLTRLPDYVTVTDETGAAAILFDPTGHGGGSEVALLAGDGGLVAQLQAGKSFMI